MKLTIGDYEIDIKARNTYGLPGYSKGDAMAFLNTLSIWAHESSEYRRMLRLDATAAAASKASDDIYNALDARGYYEGL